MKSIPELIKEEAQRLIEEQKKAIEEYPQKHPGYKYPYKVFTTEEHEKGITERVFRGIPPRYHNATLEDNDFKKIMSRPVYMYGPAGTGKTYTLYGMLKLIRIYRDAEIWNVPEVLADFRSKFNEKEGESEIIETISTKRILLIDDFGAEKQTEWNTEILYRLINFRYENMLPTFFASNLNLQQLAEKSGDRIVSRIAEMCEVVKLEGKDRRLS